MMKSLHLAVLVLIALTVKNAHGQEGHFVESNGVNISYTTFGSGPPVLIINGGPGFSSEGFVPLAKRIAKEGFQTILYDQRGTGKSAMSQTDSTNITLDLMTADIEAIRKDLGIDEWIVMGHSFGGMMGNYYAAKHPSKVKAMVASSSGGIDLALLGNAQEDLYSKLSETEIDSMQYWSAQMREGENFEHARKQFAKYMAPAYVFDRKFIPVVAERLTQGDFALNGMVWQDMIRIGFDCKDALRSFDKPVLIIQGKQDVISEDLALQADSVFPNSEIVLLDSCSHYGWLDQPYKYFNTIFEFLRDVDRFTGEEMKVKKVLKNYVLSIYKTDSSLAEKIADASLQKSGHYYSPKRKEWSYSNMDFEALKNTAATYNQQGWIPEWAPVEIEIYEVREKVASAKVKAIWGFDYMLLSKALDEWMIDKVLWQSYTPEERDAYFNKLKAYSEKDKTQVLSIPETEAKTLYRGAFAPDGKALYFFKKTGSGESYRIFKAEVEHDQLAPPQPVNLGESSSDLYPTLSPDGKDLVFISYRSNNSEEWPSNAYLWHTGLKSNGTWSEPQLLESLNFKGQYHSNPAFTAKGHLVYRVTASDWKTSTTYMAQSNGTNWDEPKPYHPVEQWKDAINGYYVWGGIPGPEEEYVILDVSEILPRKSRSPSDLWISYQQENDWTKPSPLGAGINEPEAWDNFPFFSPDGETLYFTRDFSEIHFIELSKIRDSSKKS